MNTTFDIKNYILEETLKSIENMPQDVYALYFFINTNEGFNAIPTLALMYNTLSELNESHITPTEECWNIAFWMIDEIPLIGNNVEDTPIAQKSTKMLSEWFSDNGYNVSTKELDPLDNCIEYTTGYRVISEIIEEIAPKVKAFFKQKFNNDVVLLFGEYSFMPSDIKKITSINGTDANIFLEYYENSINETEKIIEEFKNSSVDCENEDYENLFNEIEKAIKELEDNSADNNDEDYEKFFAEFLKKVEADFNFEEEK